MSEGTCDPTAIAVSNEDLWIAAAIAAGIILIFNWIIPSARAFSKPGPTITSGGLFRGADGRTSTSKATAILWTIALAFAFLVQALAGDIECVGDNFQEEYLFLLGGPFAAALGAKLITSQKVANGEIEKPEATEAEQGAISRVSQLVTDDEGQVDALGDFQYFVFNLVALVVFLTAFIEAPEVGLPDLPATLVGLTSASAFTYVTKKGVYSETPAIVGIAPLAAGPGDWVTIWGSNLLTREEHAATTLNPTSPPAFPGSVLVGSQQSPAVQVTGLNPPQLRFQVPVTAPVGTVSLSVLTSAGASTSESRDLEIIRGVEVFSVIPSRLILGSTDQVTINGRGFAPNLESPGVESGQASSTVTIDGAQLETVGTPTPTSITARVPIGGEGALQENQQAKVVVTNHLGRPSEPFVVWVGSANPPAAAPAAPVPPAGSAPPTAPAPAPDPAPASAPAPAPADGDD